jgi:hypothetical protein
MIEAPELTITPRRRLALIATREVRRVQAKQRELQANRLGRGMSVT